MFKLFTKKCSAKLNNKGMTMVEVLIGFVLLSIFLGGLSGIISNANKMYLNSVDIKHMQEDFSKTLCQESTGTEVTGINFELQVVKTDNYFMKNNKAVLSKAALYITEKDYDEDNGATYTMHAYSIDYKE